MATGVPLTGGVDQGSSSTVAGMVLGIEQHAWQLGGCALPSCQCVVPGRLHHWGADGAPLRQPRPICGCSFNASLAGRKPAERCCCLLAALRSSFFGRAFCCTNDSPAVAAEWPLSGKLCLLCSDAAERPGLQGSLPHSRGIILPTLFVARALKAALGAWLRWDGLSFLLTGSVARGSSSEVTAWCMDVGTAHWQRGGCAVAKLPVSGAQPAAPLGRGRCSLAPGKTVVCGLLHATFPGGRKPAVH